MKINKLTASFGKLENETLKLHDGLNVIYAPNESGKSTWCAFIRAMLYGVDSAQRSRTGFLPDKLRYAPWSGAPMEGSMEVTADRCNITISRTTKAKGAPMREFSAFYTGSSVPVEGLNADNCGEMLTGVSRDVFRRSAFVEQGTVAVTGSPELEKRISTIVSTGEEHSSFSEADETLRSWLRRRRFNRRGLIPQLEGEMDDVQRRLSDMGISAQDIEQLEQELEKSRELEKRISTIVSTGEEHSSFSEADETLRSWLRRRRFNRRGLIPQLEGEMDDVQRRLSDMGISAQDIEQLEQELEKSRADCDVLEKQVTESRKKQRREALDTLHRGRELLKESSERHDEALRRLSGSREALRSGQFGEESEEAVELMVDEDREKLRQLYRQQKKKPSPLLAILFFILSAAGAWFYTQTQELYAVIVSVVCLIPAVALILRYSSRRRAINEALEKQNYILNAYGVDSVAKLNEVISQHHRLWEAVRQNEAEEYESRLEYESTRSQLEKLEETALGELDFTGGSSPAAILSRQLAAERERAQKLSSRISSLLGRLAATGDPLVLSSELSRMMDEYEQLNLEYDAIALAAETLRAADEQIQSRFSPQLGRLASRYMSLMTGGRYSDILINRDFTAMIRTKDDAVARESEYLSAGTLDLMYLAVRLAVCELALPEGETCPLVIDDALVNLDEDRFEQAMELLREIARSRQVILFTCRKGRELLPAQDK